MTDSEGMDKRVLGGAGWMLSMKLGMRVLGLISILILARLLVPEDFGLVAMGTSAVALIDLFRAFSFDIVLIQRDDVGPRHLNTVWSLQVLFAAIMAAALFAAADLAAAFFGEPRLAPVVHVLALSVFVSGFENIGIVYFRKDFEFRKEFVFMIGKKVIGFLITVPLAFMFRSYWALVAGIVATSVGGLALSFTMHPYRPWFSLSAAREIMSFSLWMLVNNVLHFLRSRSVDFIVGRSLGATLLGVLTLAHDMANMLTSELMQPINRALLPGFAKLGGAVDSIKKSYIQVLNSIAVFVVPAALGLAVVSEDLVHVAFGTEWLAAIEPIRLLAIYGALVALQSMNGTVFLALGRPRLITAIAATSVAIALPLLIFLTYQYGIIGACYALLASVLILMPINFVAIRYVIGLRLADIGRTLVRPLAAGLVMTGICIWIREAIPADTTPEHALRLAAVAMAGVATYTGCISLLWVRLGRPEGVEQYLYDRFLKRRQA